MLTWGARLARVDSALGSVTTSHPPPNLTGMLITCCRSPDPVEVWFTTAGRKLEHHWAEFLEAAPRFRVPIRRFGSSDYHRSRLSHLFYSRRRPSFRWFQQQMMEGFEGVEVEQFLVLSSSEGVTAG